MKKILFVLISCIVFQANAQLLQCDFRDGEFYHAENVKFRVVGGTDDVGHYEAFIDGEWMNAYIGFVGRQTRLSIGGTVDDLNAVYELCGEINSDGFAIAKIQKAN